MTYLEALDALAGHSHIKRFRELCADDNSDVVQRDAWRAQIVTLVPAELSLNYPPLIAQAGNAARAVGRLTSALVRRQRIWAEQSEYEQRQAICANCEFLDSDRCKKCGCFVAAKARLKTESCPIGKW
jgi:hypothetical protein